MAHRVPRRTGGKVPFLPRIERRSLHEQLDAAARRRVCMMIGAAGWGKSTAVGSWARERAVAWLRLERHPADPDRFARRLCEQLRRHAQATAADVPGPVLSARDDGAADAVAICAWLREWLTDDLVLVVDDVQELPPGGGPVRLLEDLCRHAPDALHLVLISRCELPFSLARLRGQGLVAEIHAAELAFDVAEVATLLRSSSVEDPPGLAEQVRQSTGGWPALTCMVVELLRTVQPDHRLGVLERASRPGERLHSYLEEEVLAPEPAPARELLRRLAVVGEVGTPTVIAPMADDGASASLLADLTRRGLVCRIPGHVDRWSLVAPLHDYFARQPGPAAAERSRLHRVAAEDCLHRGAHAEALRHLMSAGEHAACAALLTEHGVTLVNSGQVDAVLDAAALPREYLTDPEIQRVLGQARQVRGQYDEALECFQRAGTGQQPMPPSLAWRVGLIAYSQGDFGEVLGLHSRTRLEREDTVDEARLLGLVAHTRRMTGDHAGYRDATARVVEAAQRAGSPSARAAGSAAQAALAACDGDWLRSDAYWVRAIEAAESAGDLLQMLRIRVLRAVHLVEAGLPREGLAEAGTVLRLGESYGDPFLTAHALTTRARASTRVGSLDLAVADLSRARDLFQRLGSRFLAWPLCGLGDVYRLRGELDRARAAYEQGLFLAEPGQDVIAQSLALIGLARVRTADDIGAAKELAARAVELGEPLHHIQAVLTGGWVALMDGEHDAAAGAAHRAAASARSRKDDPGLAEALTLVVLSSADPAQHGSTLAEAVQIWEDAGCRIEAAAARIVAHCTGAPLRDADPDGDERILWEVGVDLESRRVAGPLGVLARSAPAVSIRSLGAFQVCRAGVPIPRTAWQSRKARDLLKILVARRRPVTRDQLMELLWPGVEPTRAGNRLSVLMTTLREVLQSPDHPATVGVLVTDGNAVWLDLGKVTVDVERFLAHAATALKAHQNGEPGAADRLAAAEAEYTGAFLEEDPYEEWAVQLAEEVKAGHIALLRALVSVMREHGDADGVVRHSQRLLQHDPYDEPAHLDLLQAHIDAAHHGEAHRCYQSYLQRMAELGVPPRPFPGHRAG